MLSVIGPAECAERLNNRHIDPLPRKNDFGRRGGIELAKEKESVYCFGRFKNEDISLSHYERKTLKGIGMIKMACKDPRSAE